MSQSRRDFIKSATLAGTGALIGTHIPTGATASSQAAGRPIVVASANGLAAVTRAMEMIQSGSDALDAVIAGVNIVEEDPNDVTVGYGGLPNEDGVVELDSAVMHGPTHRAGAVGALRNIKTPSKVARKVMDRSDHVLLVGEGALRFAKAHGFKEEDLLTDKAREAWLYWKEHLSTKDDWLPPHTPDDANIGQALHPLLQNAFGEFYRHTGTIHCSALDGKGNLSCVTTTSGLAFKIPGRIGDSPIIGAGLYVDNEVGSAGSTGRGEANLENCSSVVIVEAMRAGKAPEEACLDACRRIVDNTKLRRLKSDAGRPDFNVVFYAINKKGEFGGASLYGVARMAVHDGNEARLVPLAFLYKKQ